MTKILLAVALLSGLLGSALYAADADEEEIKPQLYQVELLVFRYLDQSRTTPEIPRLPEPEIEDVLDEKLAQLSVAEHSPEPSSVISGDAVPLAEIIEPERFWRITSVENRQLLSEARRLQQLEAYELIEHLAWIQAAPELSSAEDIYLDEILSDSASLDNLQWPDDVASRNVGAHSLQGSVKLYKKRYLHLVIDFGLAEPERSTFSVLAQSAQRLPVAETLPAITDSRRMRLGRLVYFDQPSFGVIAQIVKLVAPEIEVEADVGG
jgi:hypothetical protein